MLSVTQNPFALFAMFSDANLPGKALNLTQCKVHGRYLGFLTDTYILPFCWSKKVNFGRFLCQLEILFMFFFSPDLLFARKCNLKNWINLWKVLGLFSDYCRTEGHWRQGSHLTIARKREFAVVLLLCSFHLSAVYSPMMPHYAAFGCLNLVQC